jgi:ferredoxin/flavodoxin---NADP+ reductase
MAELEPNATVTSRRDPSERLAIVTVRPDGWELPDFEPGQYATLGLPDPEGGKPLRRVYSIASAPGQPELEFYVQLVKEGHFTTLLWPHQPGDRIHLSPRVTGRFTLECVPPGSDLVLIGTGTGIAPFLSMVRRDAGAGRWRSCVVVHGARTVPELGYRAELEALCARDPSLTFVPIVSRDAAATWPGLRGRVQALLDDALRLDPERTHVFLCGNPAMIDDMDVRLAARGFRHNQPDAPGNLHFERWW